MGKPVVPAYRRLKKKLKQLKNGNEMEENQEYVVLVDAHDRETGIEVKSKVHSAFTPLHRAFSLFLFRRSGQLLLQQRSFSKKTWPGIWSNSCCGHPMPGESYEHAVIRRTGYELGAGLKTVIKISDYRYCFSKDRVMENEICPIFAGFYEGEILPHPDEVQAVQWINWEDWVRETALNPDLYTPWCVEETRILAESPVFYQFMQ